MLTLEAVEWLETVVVSWKWKDLPLHRSHFHTSVHWHSHKTTHKRHWKAPASCLKPPDSQVDHVIQPPDTLLFIELLQAPLLLLHKTSPSDRPARSGGSHIQWGFCAAPFEWLFKIAFSVSECRKTSSRRWLRWIDIISLKTGKFGWWWSFPDWTH